MITPKNELFHTPQMLPTVKKDVPDVLEDFMHAREKLLQTIEQCEQTIEELTELANQSQNARYYEALNQAHKTMLDATSKVLELQERIRKMQADAAAGPKTVKNTNLFVGSTSELLKLIKDVEKDTKTIETDPTN